MFVYILKISGLPQDAGAFELLETEFGVSQHVCEEAMQGDGEIKLTEPVRNGELFFESELKTLGQSFTALSRAGLQFVVLRQRYHRDPKLVADYTDTLKIGRKAWREEKLRVDAASDSLESFLCEEASSEDMEVLRPLFPNDVTDMLRDSDTGVMKGSEMLQKVFPSLKGSDARRIFYQMQTLFEKRAGKWKSRLGCAWVSVYFLMSVLVGFAIYDWLTESIDLHGLISAPLAFVLGLTPFVGSIIAYISATSLWEWGSLSAFIVFFWYYFPIAYLIVLLLAATFRGEGKTTWQRMIGNARRNRNNDVEEED